MPIGKRVTRPQHLRGEDSQPSLSLGRSRRSLRSPLRHRRLSRRRRADRRRLRWARTAQRDGLGVSSVFTEVAMRRKSSKRVPGRIGVVGVVASAGGIGAITAILRDLPGEFPAPVVVFQHLSPAPVVSQTESQERRDCQRPGPWTVTESFPGRSRSARRPCAWRSCPTGPSPYAQAVDGFKIGPESLACGLAVHRGQAVLTTGARS